MSDPDGCGCGCFLYFAIGFIVTVIRLKVGLLYGEHYADLETFALTYFFMWPLFLLVDLSIHGLSALGKLLILASNY